MMDKNTVLGKALYLEFRRGDYTLQIILTPEVVDENGELRTTTLMRRQISEHHPRKSWRFDSARTADRALRNVVRNPDGTFKEYELSEAKHFAQQGLAFISPLLSQVHHQGWTLQKQPVAVEYSFEDLALVRSQSTPQGLIRRVLRSREALGFDKNLFAMAE